MGYTRKSENPPILIYNDWGNMVLNMSDEDAGFVFKSIFRHRANPELEISHSDPIINGLIGFFLGTIDRNKDSYIDMCNANADNAKGKNKKQSPTMVSDGQQPLTNANDGQQSLTMVSENKNKNKNKNSNSNSNNNKNISSNEEIKEESFSIEKDEKKTSSRFVPPTLDEIADYCAEKKYNIDPERFFNYYESKGWMVGKTKMTKWKNALANWVKTEKEKGYNHQPIKIETPIPEEEDEILKLFRGGGS